MPTFFNDINNQCTRARQKKYRGTEEGKLLSVRDWLTSDEITKEISKKNLSLLFIFSQRFLISCGKFLLCKAFPGAPSFLIRIRLDMKSIILFYQIF